MRRFPRDAAFDSTLALLREGYMFISRRCDRHCSEAFEIRLMLRSVVCVRGMDSAAMFYAPGRFTRKGAIPPTTLALLQDFGSVQRLDGLEHRHRKQMFLGCARAEPMQAARRRKRSPPIATLTAHCSMSEPPRSS